MDVKILSGDFKLRCVLDSFNALTFSESFNEAGQLFLSVPFERKIYDSLDTPCRILIDSRLFGVDKVSATESEIRVWGSGILKELSEFYIKKKDTEKLKELDSEFHETIYNATGNIPLCKTLSQLHRKIKTYRKLSLTVPGRLEKSIAEHREIYEAIASGNGELADRLTSLHIERALENMIAAFGDAQD
jgi:DNA-binding FadR family transcriptional regulator